MAETSSSPKRLFWLIVLSLFIPYLAVGIEFGASKPLAINLVLGLVIPMALLTISSASDNKLVFAVAQLFSFAAVVQSIYLLCTRRYSNASEPESSELDHSVSSPPPYAEPSVPVAAPTSKSASGVASESA